MAFVALFLAFTIFLLWLHFLWDRRKFYKVAFQLPGPIGWPFIGVGLNMMHPEKYLQYMERTAKNYESPFISWMGPKCFLYVNDPETAEQIFNSPQCVNKGDFYRFLSNAIGDGLFTSSVPRWNLHRRLINPAFHRTVLNNFLPIFNSEADALLDKFDESDNLEMFELLKRSVLETACQTTMGQKMNFQNNGSSAIFVSYNGLTETCVKRMLSPWLYPDFIFQRSALFAHQKKVVDVLFGFIENLLQRKIKSNFDAHLTEQRRKKDSFVGGVSSDGGAGDGENISKDCNDFELSGIDNGKSKAIFVEQIRIYVDQGQLNWNDVRDEANVIIAASFETTSTALYFVCLCLAIHPQYQDKLYEELVELFPPHCSGDANSNNKHNDDGNGNGDGRQIRFEHVTKAHIDRMIYTEMVINEAMRLFSPVPMVLRRISDNECRLKRSDGSNIILPIDTQIGVDIYNMQRSELVWGSYAKQYRPELHFGLNATKRHPFAFIPFTKGLRMCLGSRYAMILMKIFVAKIFLNFRLSTNAKLDDLIIKGTISLKLADYPVFQISKR